MKKLPNILATTLLCVYSSTSFANADSEKIKNLEARIAKMEKKSANSGSQQISDFLKKNTIFGRLQFDQTFVTENQGNANLYDNSKLRRGRVGVKGKLEQGFGYKFEIDFANNATKVTDAYIKKSLSGDKSAIKIGQFKEPFSLEELTSSRFITFLERASINGLAPGRKIGLQYEQHYDNANFFAGLFADGIGSSKTATGDSSKSAATRIAFFNQNANKDVIHLGVAYRVSKPTASQVSYKFAPEASIDSSASAIKASEIPNVDRINQLGLELATVSGPFSVQGEYIRSDISRSSGQNYYLDGYYLQLSAFLTDGDKRNYNSKTSAFDRVKPKCKKGAWEVAYRFSQTNANHNGLEKGIMNNNTIGLNYYATNNVRFLLNYIDINVDKNSVYVADAQVASLRAQIDF